MTRLLAILSFVLWAISIDHTPPSSSNVSAYAPTEEEIRKVIVELDLSLDAFFELLDNDDIRLLAAGIRHAARARVLLEGMLGDNIDIVSRELLMDDPDTYHLRMTARLSADLAGDIGIELWIKDLDYVDNAKLRLVELDGMFRILKAKYEGDK